jgi:hypothetical protein
MDASRAGSRHILQLWSFRCLVQSTLLNHRKQPSGEDFEAVSCQLRVLEETSRFFSRRHQLYEDPKGAQEHLEAGSYSSKRASAEKEILWST